MASPPEAVTQRLSASVLTRYVTAATLARSADAAAGIGLLLLSVVPATGLEHPARTGGLLVAALTVPHLIGPVLARRLDLARDGRGLLAGGMAAYGLLIASAGLALGRLPVGIVAVLLVLAGACAPLPVGGLSSRLSSLTGPDERERRRGEGWDAVTYGLAGSLGPAAVAGLAALASPRLALLAVAGAGVTAALVTLTLPRLGSGEAPGLDRPGTVAVLRSLATVGPLRRVTYATLATALVLGALGVLVVQLGPRLGSGPTSGAVLATAFGVGNLAGSLLLTVRPLHGEPERLTSRFVGVIALGLVGAALAPTFPLALVAFGAVGAANAPFFTATLAARADYAPRGARAQVFVAVSALKIAAASAGTAVAGLSSTFDPRTILAVGSAVVAAAAAGTVLERRRAAATSP